MAVDPTGGISQMMEILRRQLAQPDATKHAASPQLQKSGARPRASQSRDPRKLERKIASRVRLLPIGSEKELRTAIRLFMEEVLLAEFGDELAQDPAFHEMVDGIARNATSDDKLSGEFRTLFKSMA